MATAAHLPVELLTKILHSATDVEDSSKVGNPVINWHSQTTLFFQRDLALRNILIATKYSIVLVCRLWNTITSSWLYEHVAIDSAAKTEALAQGIGRNNSSINQFGLLVKRLDIELPELAEDSKRDFYRQLARVLLALPNLVTLTMTTPPYALMHELLSFIPASVSHLFWSSPVAHGEVRHLSKAPLTDLFIFLRSHPRLETISFPFTFRPLDGPNPIVSGYRKPHPTIREWVLRNFDHFASSLMLVNRGLCPKIAACTMTSQVHTQGIEMLLLYMNPTHPSGIPNGNAPNITALSLVVGLPDQTWPPECLATKLDIIGNACPNLREFNLTLTSDTEDVYNAPMEPDTTSLHPVPQITTISIQRVVQDSDLSDPIGTLHHAIRVPWKTVFPGVQAIRIHENVDLGEVMEHPTMVFVREEGWTIRIEDRFGELPVELEPKYL